jgi:hypothetical protein
VYNTRDGDSWCEAKTSNESGQVMDLTFFDSGDFTAYVFDDRWSLSERQIQFRLDVDYKRWDIAGSARANSISVTPDDPGKAIEFLRDLMKGSAVALYNESGLRLGTFSLRGSSAAIRELADCYTKIGVQDRASADPFGPSATSSNWRSDPF